MDPATIVKGLAALGAVFGKEITDPMVSGYTMGLHDLSDTEFTEAVRLAVETLKFFPKPVELRSLVRGDPKANLEAEALEAWAEVMRQIRSEGYYGKPSFDPATAKAVKQLGSWKSLCDKGAEALNTWGQKQFLAVYEAFEATEKATGTRSRISNRDLRTLDDGIKKLAEGMGS